MSALNTPQILLILDGWGAREAASDNAISQAHTPHWDALLTQYPHTLLDASGESVGLPAGQMGNSEVGHLNIGAGRIIYQDLSRIDRAIADGTFAQNPALVSVCGKVANADKALHVFGLLSPGGIHSHQQHLAALLHLAKQQGVSKLYVHAFLDGRDTPPQSAQAAIDFLSSQMQAASLGQIASISGRYYAMDRDQRWERVEPVYRLLTEGVAPHHAESATAGLEAAYARGETDEFVQATLIEPRGIIRDGDAVIFMNFRSDRARQLSRAFTQDDFVGFNRVVRPKLAEFVTLTSYADDIPATLAFGPAEIKNSLGEYLASQGLSQCRVAETEKYAHVTFFLNGGVEAPNPQEARVLIPSPKVATYDLQPQMSAPAVTDALCEAIVSGEYDVIICNYANADMVGHTGNMNAAIRAVETLDTCLGRVIAAAKTAGGEVLITADHGNVEQMHNPHTGQAHTAHTNELVPLVYIGRKAEFIAAQGKLADVAPTLLFLLGLPIPPEMTGDVLLALT